MPAPTPTLNPQTPESPVFQKYTLSGVDFNALGDNQVPISLSEFVSRYQVLNVWVTNASATIVTATAGLFTAAYAQGFAIAPSQILTITNNTADNIGNAQSMELANQRTIVFSDMTLYFNVSTAEGTAAKADVHITIQLL